MPYNEEIETRIMEIVGGWENCTAKKMFGGICHLRNGNMFCGVYKDYLILRLGENAAAGALRQQHVRPFDITGRPMKGWVMVESTGFKSDNILHDWLEKARSFADSLPPK